MSTAHDTVNLVFTAAWENALAKGDAADARLAQAASFLKSPPQLTGAKVHYTPATVTPEISEASNELLTQLDGEARNLIRPLTDLFLQYLQDHFPFPQELALARAWLLKALRTGGTGLSAETEDMAWQAARADAARASVRAARMVVDEYAARGFTRPPGAAYAKLEDIDSEAGRKVVDGSTEVAKKQIQMEVENIRFAVEQALALYAQMLEIAGALIKTYADAAGLAVKKVEQTATLEGRLRNAIAAFDRLMVSINEISTKVEIANIGLGATTRSKNIGWQAQTKQIRAGAAADAARSFGSQAAALLNGLHASARIEVNDREGISYNYGGDVTGDVPAVT